MAGNEPSLYTFLIAIGILGVFLIWSATEKIKLKHAMICLIAAVCLSNLFGYLLVKDMYSVRC